MFCSDMTDDATAQSQMPARDASRDRQRAVLERQLHMVERLAESGLAIAEAIGRQATDPPETVRQVVQGDISAAHARVAKAVRLALMLQSKLMDDLRRLDSLAEIEAKTASMQADAERPRRVADRKIRVRRVVERVAPAEGGDRAEVIRLSQDAAERLDQDDIYGDVLSKPVSELVDIICKALGLSPDWPRLAEEAWAQEEMKTAAPGAPLAALMAARAPPDPAESSLFQPRAASP
jgi:hypothetical protein